jgi:hypothetical protein
MTKHAWVVVAVIALAHSSCDRSNSRSTLTTLPSEHQASESPGPNAVAPEGGTVPDRANPADRPSEGPSKRGTPVSASLEVSENSLRRGNMFRLTMVLEVAPGFEIQTLTAAPPAIATRLQLELPPGVESNGDWTAPVAVRSMAVDGHASHTGRTEFTRELIVGPAAVPGLHELRCAIRYQACDAQRCLRPEEFTLSIPLTIE